MEDVVTSGGGRAGWVRNSGYVTMGGRSVVDVSVVSDVREVSEEGGEGIDEAEEASVVAVEDWW